MKENTGISIVFVIIILHVIITIIWLEFFTGSKNYELFGALMSLSGILWTIVLFLLIVLKRM